MSNREALSQPADSPNHLRPLRRAKVAGLAGIAALSLMAANAGANVITPEQEAQILTKRANERTPNGNKPKFPTNPHETVFWHLPSSPYKYQFATKDPIIEKLGGIEADFMPIVETNPYLHQAKPTARPRIKVLPIFNATARLSDVNSFTSPPSPNQPRIVDTSILIRGDQSIAETPFNDGNGMVHPVIGETTEIDKSRGT